MRTTIFTFCAIICGIGAIIAITSVQISTLPWMMTFTAAMLCVATLTFACAAMNELPRRGVMHGYYEIPDFDDSDDLPTF